MKTKILALVLVVISSTTSSQTYFGVHDCGKWVANNTAAKVWLMGYLSGINYMAVDMNKLPIYDPLSNINSADQAYLWMDNYCRSNPLSNVRNGASILYLELAKK